MWRKAKSLSAYKKHAFWWLFLSIIALPYSLIQALDIYDHNAKYLYLCWLLLSLSMSLSLSALRKVPCGAAPTHRKPGQTKAPAQYPLAFSWLFALLLENIHKIHSKPWVVSVMICLDGSVPATNQFSQQTLLSWHSVTGSPTLGLNWTKNRLKRGESGGKRWHSMFYT